MPELPEVEVVRQSLAKNVTGKKIKKILVRNRKLRFFLDSSFDSLMLDVSSLLKSRLEKVSLALIWSFNHSSEAYHVQPDFLTSVSAEPDPPLLASSFPLSRMKYVRRFSNLC